MANLTINFDKNITTSLQKGDTVLFLKNGSLIELGLCQSVVTDRLSFVVDVGLTRPRSVIGDYFMFAKYIVLNSSGFIGYVVTIKMEKDCIDFC